ncbi:MAG: nucleoside-diphosphate kinase [bacterium]
MATKNNKAKTIERTLVLLKPDTVKRCLIGRIIERFENAGLKIIGMKMTRATKEMALAHYTEDIAKRRGQHVRDILVDFIKDSPVVAIAIEGHNAIENVRMMAGDTEPKSAQPGTIRGDFSHISFAGADAQKKVVQNIIHASSDKKDAKRELYVWFNDNELFDYQTVHEIHTF